MAKAKRQKESLQCPCGSALEYESCCGRWHESLAAPDALALMKSRYSAFVKKRGDYLLATWHPSTCPKDEVLMPDSIKWLGLTVESFQDGEREAWVTFKAKGKDNGEGCAVPIAAGTELAELLKDDAAVLVSPVPSMLEELLAGKVSLLDTLLSEAVNHLSLGSYTGVVGTWYPASVLALHACTANENILDSIVEHVSHVEHTRYVWWRDHHCIRFTTIWLRAEKLVVEPVLIPFTFHCLWIVFTC